MRVAAGMKRGIWFGTAVFDGARETEIKALLEAAGLPSSGKTQLVDGMLGALGAVLLILPGFLTDIAGLVLLAPSVRQTVARRFGLSMDVPLARPPRRPGDRTIDLPQADWTRLDNPRNP